MSFTPVTSEFELLKERTFVFLSQHGARCVRRRYFVITSHHVILQRAFSTGKIRGSIINLVLAMYLELSQLFSPFADDHFDLISQSPCSVRIFMGHHDISKRSTEHR